MAFFARERGQTSSNNARSIKGNRSSFYGHSLLVDKTKISVCNLRTGSIVPVQGRELLEYRFFVVIRYNGDGKIWRI